ncbi:MAG TPA: hypothetical protein VG429_06190 [Casimicrobiaceae bacterium]|jgi:hypothetical protein|nr:hypothetical protein [Casimicrobiaceae bacterium]
MMKEAGLAVRPSAHEYGDPGPIATIEEFTAALLATRDWIGISPTQLQMLQAQCRAPDATITAAQLASQLSFKNSAAARLQYGTLARAIAEKLGYAPPQKGKGPVRWWFALSIGQAGQDDAGDGQYKWIMRPELVSALRTMKWA